MLYWFSAKYKGHCGACGKQFDVDSQIAYAESPDKDRFDFNVDNVLVAEGCCAGTGFEVMTQVMPRGKTKKDACGACFIIHATNQKDCYE
jgi:hypothetical protein